MYDVVALGELLIDFAMVGEDAGGYPVMAAHPGGAPCNYLAALAKYGVSTALVGKVGDDEFGRLLRGTLEKENIGTQGLIMDPKVFTTLAFVTLDRAGERSFSFARKPGADTMLRAEEVDLSLVDGCKVLHFGTLSLTDEPARTATVETVEYARRAGKYITFDPNLRRPLWKNLENAREQMLWGCHRADVVKISDEEVDFLWACDPEEGAERLVRACGVRLAMVTLGASGCILRTREHTVRIAPPRVHAVDTTGAGDIFGGSAVARLLELGKEPEELGEEDLLWVGRYAAASASLSTTRPGGISSAPERAEVEAILSQGQRL